MSKEKTPRKKLALHIGINDYPNGNELVNCANDAHSLRGVTDARDFTVLGELLNADATRANILDAMRVLVGKLGRGDVGFITYSGHGTYVNDADGDEPDGRDECLCPVDCFEGNLITDDELLDIFNDRERGSRLIFFSDSCHSGTVSRFAAATPAGCDAPRVRFLPPSELPLSRRLMPAGRGLVKAAPLKSSALLLAGCRDYEYSYDGYDGRPNGAFTGAALDALAELPERATYRQWMTAIRTRLPSRSLPQSPQLFGTASQAKWKVLE